MNKSHLLCAVCAYLLLITASFNAVAVTVLQDSYNCGSLDPAWTVTLSGDTAIGWSHNLTTSLNVFNVVDVTPNTDECA